MRARAIALTTAAALALLAGTVTPAPADDKKVVVTSDGDHKEVWVKTRAKTWDSEHKTWVQRGGYVGYRIPDDKSTTYLGPEHTFRINTLPYRLVDGESRYQYNGYWVTVVDPWPESWTEGWWNNDDVYIRYDDGYYLYNNRYPDTGLAVKIYK